MFKLFYVLILVCLLYKPVIGQKNNYVIQNSPSSYGFSISSAATAFNAKNINLKKGLGLKTSFGVSYMIHRGLFGIESGLSFTQQRYRFGEKIVLDSINNQYALKLRSFSLPININYNFSKNRRRTYMLFGVNPEFVTRSNIVSNKNSAKEKEIISVYSNSNKLSLMFGGHIGIGRTYDFDQTGMFRIELRYGYSTFNILEDKFRLNTLGIHLQFMNHN